MTGILMSPAPVEYSINGKLLSDPVLIIPRLSKTTPFNKFNVLLTTSDSPFVLVDLNITLNLLWVSIKSIPGKSLEVAIALHMLILDAKYVAYKL